jgi:hypothetical protein
MAFFRYILTLAFVMAGCKKHESIRHLQSPHYNKETQRKEENKIHYSTDNEITENTIEFSTKNQDRYSFFLDFLYFKAIQDGLKYAQWVNQNPTFHPISSSIDQPFNYSPGSRISFSYILPNNKDGEIRINWMYYYAHPNNVHATSNNFSILAVLALPIYGINQNNLVDAVQGKWRLIINAFDLDFKIPLHLAKRFILSPSGGIKAGFVTQHIDVHYSNFQIFQQAANTPQHVKAKSHMWGIGPLIGLEGDILLPSDFSIFFNGGIAGLAGKFRLTTAYTDFLSGSSEAPENAKLKITDHKWRISAVEQLSAGIAKKWSIQRTNKLPIKIEFALGWEVQIWTRQMRLSMFDTFVEPSDGSDLTLYGPFARWGMRF